MPELLDLPTELLCQILEEVGGRELRKGRGTERLCLNRRWYAAALPVYLSGLEVAVVYIDDSKIFEVNTDNGSRGDRRFMQKNTRELHIRLLGNWRVPPHGLIRDKDSKGAARDGDGDPTVSAFEHLIAHERQAGEESARMLWRDHVLLPRLNELFVDLRHFTALEELVLESSLEHTIRWANNPRRDYIYHSTLCSLLHNVPVGHDLSLLTLDLSTHWLDESSDAHVCEILADIVPRIQHVWLRVIRICPALLHMRKVQGTDVRLKTLVIKMHLPIFVDPFSNGSLPCWQMQGLKNGFALFENVVQASRAFVADLALLRQRNLLGSTEIETPLSESHLSPPHGLDGFRVSYPNPVNAKVEAIDCLKMRRLLFREAFYAYEDDGTPCWFELTEESERMTDGGPFVSHLPETQRPVPDG